MRAWQPTPVFLSGESHGQKSLADRVPKSQTRLKQLSMHASIINNFKYSTQVSKFIYKQIVHTNIKKVNLA